MTLPQDMGGALAGDFKADGGHAQSQALRGVWECFQELQGRLRMTATFLAEVKIVNRLETGQAETVQSAGKAPAAKRESRCPSFPCLSLLGFAGRAGRLQGPSCFALYPSHLLRHNSTGC